MAHMTGAIRKILDEFINSIPDRDLEEFVRAAITRPGDVSHAIDFGSDDFQLIYTGDSNDEHTPGWKMVELRANSASKDGALKSLALHSTKFNPNRRRFALIMYSGPAMVWMGAQHVRMALKKSPVWEEGVINKVHVDYDHRVTFHPHPVTHEKVPWLAAGMLPSDMYEYTSVPFDGFNVDGTEVSKPGKQEKKKKGAAGKK